MMQIKRESWKVYRSNTPRFKGITMVFKVDRMDQIGPNRTQVDRIDQIGPKWTE